ncbi:hypothetical protein PVK06_024482 [Gossypium arboreum]|uniref:Uncharacterized protein n=1 Tax=Gossypium arboreum TaxID=29729 RepID=A0ABR0PEG3_GOSAR|nr:hypothetical protein PVK06_024482 [Gossypium arboreum]
MVKWWCLGGVMLAKGGGLVAKSNLQGMTKGFKGEENRKGVKRGEEKERRGNMWSGKGERRERRAKYGRKESHLQGN